MFVVGLDISLKSPAMAIFHTSASSNFTEIEIAKHANWEWYAFQQQQIRAPQLPHSLPNIHLLPPIPTSSSSNMVRYKHIIDNFLFILTESLCMHQRQPDFVGIEGPAPNAQIGNAWKLGELCGILKWELVRNGLEEKIRILAPNTWKKFGVNNGDATKLQVLQFVLQNGPRIDILRAMNQQPNKLGEVPTPSQDIGDSTGIVLALLNPAYHLQQVKKAASKNVKKTRRKKTDSPKKRRLQSAVTLLIEKQQRGEISEIDESEESESDS